MARLENTYHDARLERLSKTTGDRSQGNRQLSPDTIKGYMALSAAGQKMNLLGGKVRELIALAVAVSLRCDGCITVHTEAAFKQGATREEIAEALGVATAVNAGATLVYSARVLDAFKELRAPSGRTQMLDRVGELICRTAWSRAGATVNRTALLGCLWMAGLLGALTWLDLRDGAIFLLPPFAARL